MAIYFYLFKGFYEFAIKIFKIIRPNFTAVSKASLLIVTIYWSMLCTNFQNKWFLSENFNIASWKLFVYVTYPFPKFVLYVLKYPVQLFLTIFFYNLLSLQWRHTTMWCSVVKLYNFSGYLGELIFFIINPVRKNFDV